MLGLSRLRSKLAELCFGIDTAAFGLISLHLRTQDALHAPVIRILCRGLWKDGEKPLADPAHDRDSLAVADRLVARTVWAFGSRAPAPGDQRVVIGEALQALALARGEASDS